MNCFHKLKLAELTITAASEIVDVIDVALQSMSQLPKGDWDEEEEGEFQVGMRTIIDSIPELKKTLNKVSFDGKNQGNN